MKDSDSFSPLFHSRLANWRMAIQRSMRCRRRVADTRVRGRKPKMFDRITFDSQIMGGRACIRGMRIPVSVIVGQIAHGATFEEIPQGYPDLEREDIQQALEYAAWLTRDEVRSP